MKDAAKDLKIKLDIQYAYDNPYVEREILQKIIKSSPKPDAVLFINHRGLAKELIKKADDAKLNTFLINSGFSGEERKAVGMPRQKYKHWLGEMYPDDEYAGYILAKNLIATAEKTNKGTIHMLAVKGPKGIDDASDKRIAGMKKALKEHPNVVLDQIVAGEWLRDIAKKKFVILKTTRYPKATIVWTACDAMALGVIDGTKELKLKPGKDIITGGIDWIDDAFTSVKKGEMAVSVGGHFMEGAWVIITLNDYFHGYDFKKENVSLRTKMFAVTPKTVDLYKNKTATQHLNSVNFAKYSKEHNPEIKKYKFDLSAL
jgi:ABC-type sugar transport system substrate-binding protein